MIRMTPAQTLSAGRSPRLHDSRVSPVDRPGIARKARISRQKAIVSRRRIGRVQNGNRGSKGVAEKLGARRIALARQDQFTAEVRGCAQKQTTRKRQTPPEDIMGQVR